MYSLILEGEGGPTEDRENSLIFFLFFIEPFPKLTHRAEAGLKLHVAASAGIIKIGCSQENLR